MLARRCRVRSPVLRCAIHRPVLSVSYEWEMSVNNNIEIIVYYSNNPRAIKKSRYAHDSNNNNNNVRCVRYKKKKKPVSRARLQRCEMLWRDTRWWRLSYFVIIIIMDHYGERARKYLPRLGPVSGHFSNFFTRRRESSFDSIVFWRDGPVIPNASRKTVLSRCFAYHRRGSGVRVSKSD